MYYCEVCRLELKERGFRRHVVSVFHRKARLIRAMLERNCITHAEIARRIGLSRERVRQFGSANGIRRREIAARHLQNRTPQKSNAGILCKSGRTRVCS